MEFLKAVNGQITLAGKPFLLRGAGLGGWLLPEGYMWQFYSKCDRPRRIEALVETLCGTQYATQFWRRYYDTFVTEHDIAFLSRCGFNSVRLPLNARHLAVNGRLCAEYVRHIDDCILWCKKYGLFVILDMHAAPGGQTGKNIDDSEQDFPALFTNDACEDALVDLWCQLAQRYQNESTVGGYDLLNEPLAQEFSSLYSRLLPLYRRLCKAIRKYDKNHLLFLEGVHWATDLKPLEMLTSEEAADNIALQFHKYWNVPDAESLAEHLRIARALNVPLFDGESGENNAAWNIALFSMLERLNIGWSFWSYKKMETANSLSVFPRPPRWGDLLAYLENGCAPAHPQALFDSFLDAVQQAEFHEEVARSLFRRVPLAIPAEAYDSFCVHTERQDGAQLRMSDPVTLLFADGHKGLPDYARYGGEPQPPAQKIFARLQAGESLDYRFFCSCTRLGVKLIFEGNSQLVLRCGEKSVVSAEAVFALKPGAHTLTIQCVSGVLMLDEILLKEA